MVEWLQFVCVCNRMGCLEYVVQLSKWEKGFCSLGIVQTSSETHPSSY